MQERSVGVRCLYRNAGLLYRIKYGKIGEFGLAHLCLQHYETVNITNWAPKTLL